jgi:hypothetical protein
MSDLPTLPNDEGETEGTGASYNNDRNTSALQQQIETETITLEDDSQLQILLVESPVSVSPPQSGAISRQNSASTLLSNVHEQLGVEEAMLLASPISASPLTRPLTVDFSNCPVPSLKPLVASPRRKGIVAFGDQVQVVVTDTFYTGHQSHLFYQLGFWIHNKVVHGVALLCMLCVLITLIVILAVKWNAPAQFQCDKPLRSIFISDIIALFSVMLFLSATMVARQVFSTFKLKQKLRRRKTRTVTPQIVEVVAEVDIPETPLTPQLASTGSFTGTPIMSVHLGKKETISPKFKKDVVRVEPLKTMFNDIHKENEV